MRLIMRLAAFALSIAVGTSAWYICAQKRTDKALPEGKVVETTVIQAAARAAQEEAEAWKYLLDQSIKFGPVKPTTGYANAKTVILRERPDADAPVVARLKMGDYESAEILDSTRDYLYVRFTASDGSGGSAARDRDYEGWTDWRSVTPTMSAVVLDAETGEVIARVPLDNMLASVAFSPDGSRAIFFGGYESSLVGCEARTNDYKMTRCITSTSVGSSNTIFYGPADGALYAAIMSRGGDYQTNPMKLKVVRLGEGEVLNNPTGISVEAEDFVVAPDGLTGFVLYRNDPMKMKVDVVDLRTFTTRNSFTLSGDLSLTSSTFVTNQDGSELYARLYQDANSVYVVDTRTGSLLRVMRYNAAAKDYWYFDSGALVGDSLLVRVWNQDEDEMHTPPHVVWLGSGGRRAAEKEISHAIEVGGARYAVNDTGTVLFKLDSDNRISARLSIERPELRLKSAEEQGLTVFGLSASPDGKRLILFVGVEEGC